MNTTGMLRISINLFPVARRNGKSPSTCGRSPRRIWVCQETNKEPTPSLDVYLKWGKPAPGVEQEPSLDGTGESYPVKPPPLPLRIRVPDAVTERGASSWTGWWPQPRCGWFPRLERPQGCPRSSANPGLGGSTPLALTAQEPKDAKPPTPTSAIPTSLPVTAP